MDLRQWLAPPVRPREKKAGASCRAGSPAAAAAIPARPGSCTPASRPRRCGGSRPTAASDATEFFAPCPTGLFWGPRTAATLRLSWPRVRNLWQASFLRFRDRSKPGAGRRFNARSAAREAPGRPEQGVATTAYQTADNRPGEVVPGRARQMAELAVGPRVGGTGRNVEGGRRGPVSGVSGAARRLHAGTTLPPRAHVAQVDGLAFCIF
jgi:hypothetical protein